MTANKNLFKIASWVLGIMALFGCEPKCDHVGQPAPAVVIQPNNQISLPTCRVIYIGQCPFAWCTRSEFGPSVVASLAPMRPHCEPHSAVVSDQQPANSIWGPRP
jgi:hypothetical protein